MAHESNKEMWHANTHVSSRVQTRNVYIELKVVDLKEEANCDMGRVNPHQMWVRGRVLMHDATPTWYTKAKLGGRSLIHFDCINDNLLNTITSQI
jgi:hypothetical protein